jgi:cell division protein FtsB
MIMLATAAVCTAVIVKAKAEFEVSTAQRHQMLSEIDDLRRTNSALELEIRRLTSDSNTIELAARERLGMVMPSDVVVPIESMRSTSGLNTMSIIR